MSDDEFPTCPRCGGGVEWVRCDQCDDGMSYHDCGEDCCCCMYPLSNVPCDQCEGRGGWWFCTNSYEYCMAHAIPGCEQKSRFS